ncbi:MAG TPA: hypothetical protein PLE19_00165 [Planctomycetota bacterium]|nr:hypothetical protein [Planctomycetota bacterium]HRR79462.1 hypothetical protein [Planctomycetota bacterium]HRT95271.1 hypothetical protein [Planctomycetota bacterium]
MIRWLAKLHSLDRRWLYLATVIVLVVPLLWTGLHMPSAFTSPATRGLYEAIEACPPDKVVWIDSSWDQGSRAENYAQLGCVVRHLCRRRIKFVVTSVAITVFAPEFADRVIRPIAEEAGYVYGRDWVNAGYVQAGTSLGAVIDGLCRDFHNVRPTDAAGTPAADLPLMQRVRSHKDIHLVYCITYSPNPEWISFANGQFKLPVAFGCMSIMSPYYSTYIDSGQLCGMLVGNRGAAEYEALNQHLAEGTTLITAGSFGNCAIILAALLGNLGFWASRRQRRKSP